MARNFRGANNLLTTLLLYKLQNNQQQQRDKAAMERLNAENAAAMERQTKEQDWRTTENEANRIFEREQQGINYQNDVGLQGMRHTQDLEMQSMLESSRKAQKEADIAREAQKAQEAKAKEDEIAESMLDAYEIEHNKAKMWTVAEAEILIEAKKYRDAQQTAIDKKNEGLDLDFINRAVKVAENYRMSHTEEEYRKWFADENGWKRYENALSPEEYVQVARKIILMEDRVSPKEVIDTTRGTQSFIGKAVGGAGEAARNFILEANKHKNDEQYPLW